MSDYGNILYYLEACKEAWESKNYLDAAVNAYWCIQYCEQGEPYGISNEELRNSESQARKIYLKASKKFRSSILSKTTFVYGTICPKLLWLYKNKYNLRHVSDKTQKKFDAGHNIGALAQLLFPYGIDASKSHNMEKLIDSSRFNLPFNLKQKIWTDQTQELYHNNTVYEAAFVYDDVFAAVDILEKTVSGHIAYEVKSGFSVSETFLKDCALQYYVINNICKLNDFFLIYINEEYLKEIQIPLDELTASNVDLSRLFIKESVLSRILPLQAYIRQNIKNYKDIIKSKEPETTPGDQCTFPYECMFWNYCNHPDYEEWW